MYSLEIPDMYYKDIFSINYKDLKKKNIKCLVFDLDNTIAPLSMKTPSTELIEFFKKVEGMGFKLIILSNALKKRVKPFKEELNIDSSYLSGKPKRKKYKRILELYGYEPEQIACIGDQLVTDIKGANRMGMVSILVDHIGKRDTFFAYISRFKASFVYRYFKKEDILVRGRYYE